MNEILSSSIVTKTFTPWNTYLIKPCNHYFYFDVYFIRHVHHIVLCINPAQIFT